MLLTSVDYGNGPSEMDQEMKDYLHLSWEEFREEIIRQLTSDPAYKEGDPFFVSQDGETEYSLKDIEKIFSVLQENEDTPDIGGAVYEFLKIFSVADLGEFKSRYLGQYESVGAYLRDTSEAPDWITNFVDWEALAAHNGTTDYEVSNGHLFRR